VHSTALNDIRLLVASLTQSARAVEQKTRMTNAQLFVLRQLLTRDCQTINQLAEEASTKQSAMSLLVSRLESDGYVRRIQSSVDRRRIEVEISAAGRRAVRDAPTAPVEILLKALRRLPPRDIRALQAGLEALLHEMGIRNRAAPLMFERRSKTK
jgi:DNA-binding MarR family transcriptional regulator